MAGIPQKINIPPCKRAFDIFVSFLLIIVSLPFLFIFFAWILLEQITLPSSRGTVIYSEKRVSQGKIFDFYKFRIFKMSVLHKLNGDHIYIHTKPLEQDKNNLTKYGYMLKQIYMDEWPQLFNVLKGDMSLVGPRPTNTVNSANLVKNNIYTKEIIKCGVTGYFQSCKDRPPKNDIEMDMDYINFCANNSCWKILWFDVKILIKTCLTVLRARGI